MAEKTVKLRTYVVIYVILLVGTGLTVWASALPLGEWHMTVALSIAVVKATLVVLYFMHLIYSDRLTWVVAFGGLLWVAILIGMTMNDYLIRPWTYPLPNELGGEGNTPETWRLTP